MKIQQINVGDALESLRSSVDGLSEAEAARRLAEYGPNALSAIKGEPLLLRFFKEFTHFFALILWVASALAMVAQWRQPGEGMLSLALAIIGVIVINGAFSFAQEYRAERAIQALQKMLPRQVQVLRDGTVASIPAENLVPGDVILISEGEDIPADCRVIEAYGARVNAATITGESKAIAKNAEPDAQDDVLRTKNILLAGTSMVSGEVKALVFAGGMHTEFGKIAHLTQEASETDSPLQKEIKRLSRQVAIIASTCGAIFFLIGQFLGFPFWGNLIFAIGIIVALVPEGLLPTVTLSLAMATQRMAARNALVRHLPAVETLGKTTVICTDKTGTLTLNVMTVKKLHICAGSDQPRLYEVMRHCHSVRKTATNESMGDPMEIALLRKGEEDSRLIFPQIDQIPFDADRKRMSTIHQTPQGRILYCKGALEALLPLCPASGQKKRELLAAEEEMAAMGLRVLALACRVLPDGAAGENAENDLDLLGLAGLEDPPRPEVPEAINRCRLAGIKVIMVTGDLPHTALSIAREINLVQGENPVVVSGEQLQHLTIAQLRLLLDSPEIIFARVAADQKMRIVKALKQKKQIVAATGDGVNDAPALKAAHIGVSMGKSGTDVARESSDMILLDDNFASIVAAIEEGRAVYDNIRKFLTYILASNIAELIPYLAFVLFRIPLPLTIIQILSIDLGTDMLPALALGAEKPDPDVMQRPPRAMHEKLLDWRLMLRAYCFLGLLEAVAGMSAFFYVLNHGGWQYGQIPASNEAIYLQATTAYLAAIILMQIANAFNCRDQNKSVFRLPANALLLASMGCELLLIYFLIYTGFGNRFFGTAQLSASVWLFILPFAFLFLALEEARKWLVRKT